jgi:hypothetical protein
MNKTLCAVITMVAMGVGTAATAAKSLRNDEAPRHSVKSIAQKKTPARRTPAKATVKKEDAGVNKKQQDADDKPSSRTDRRHA